MSIIEIVATDGTDSDDGIPRWITLDDEDCAIDGVDYSDGDTIADALRKFASAGVLAPTARVVRTQRVGTWPQLVDDTRYTVEA